VTVGPGQSSTFKAELTLLSFLDTFAGTSSIALFYDVGRPTSSLTVHDCQARGDDPPPPPFTVQSSWPDDYYVLHESELNDFVARFTYHAFNWIETGDRDPWAFKEYTGGRTVYGILYTEGTLMKLTHTPE
jgi:hypothetical protein